MEDQQNNIEVSISCITYNHAKYIRQCLDGFIMQKCKFKFEILIHDDASTDGTIDILKEYESKYPNLIKPIIQKKNQYSQGVRGMNATFNFPRAKGKYIAMCEGDDYWTDPLKLQKQVEFLEKNEDYGLVFTDIDRIYQGKNIIERKVLSNNGYEFCETFDDYLIYAPFRAPCTWVFRSNLLGFLPSKSYAVGDLPILLTIIGESKIYKLNESTAVYRVLVNSASHFTDYRKSYAFMKGIYDIQIDYGDKYNVDQKVINKIQENFARDSYYYAIAVSDLEQIKWANNILKKSADIPLKLRLAMTLSRFKVVRFLVRKKLERK